MLIKKYLPLNTLSLGLLLTSSIMLTACGGDSTDSTAPSISNLHPNNNEVTQSRQVIITGQASDDVELKSVVIISEEQSITAEINDGSFSATLEASAGQNTYSVIATDISGNETSSEESFYFGAQASAGGAHSAIIKNERIYAWGRNNKGQAGIGAITTINDDPETASAAHPTTPTLISVPSDTSSLIDSEETHFVSLAFNQNASSALDVNGQVWSWGDGDDGQLGLGIADDDLVDETNYTSPQKIENLSDIVSISRGYDHMLLLKSDGT
ncbi:MAG TPA: hypothetical protein DIC30_09580, partial [Oceanospirillales bacterium]|nr:hypothetical protein [Oceanospirillales bacterium]